MKQVKARHVVLHQSLKKPLRRTKASGLRHYTIITAGCAVLSREFGTIIDANFCTYCINRSQAILPSVHTNESESCRKTRMTGTLAHALMGLMLIFLQVDWGGRWQIRAIPCIVCQDLKGFGIVVCILCIICHMSRLYTNVVLCFRRRHVNLCIHQYLLY